MFINLFFSFQLCCLMLYTEATMTKEKNKIEKKKKRKIIKQQ